MDWREKEKKGYVKGVHVSRKAQGCVGGKKGGTERLERERGGIDHATVRLRLAVVARASLERQPEVRIKCKGRKMG